MATATATSSSSAAAVAAGESEPFDPFGLLQQQVDDALVQQQCWPQNFMQQTQVQQPQQQQQQQQVQQQQKSHQRPRRPPATANNVAAPVPICGGAGGGSGRVRSFDPFGLEQEETQQQKQPGGDGGRSGSGGGASSSTLLPPEVDRITKYQKRRGGAGAGGGGTANAASVNPPSTMVRNASGATAGGGSGTGIIHQLPPKMLVKLSVHEEVVSSVPSSVPSSSAAITIGNMNSVITTAACGGGGGGGAGGTEIEEGSSEVTIEGSVYAQVQCSDAKRNAPFLIRPSLAAASVYAGGRQGGGGDGDDGNKDNSSNLSFGPGPASKFSRSVKVSGNGSGSNGASDGVVATIPKREIGYVPVARYSFTERIRHLPLLLERKVTYNAETKVVRVAVQVRTKLSNAGSLEDLAIAVGVPERIDGDTVEVMRGDGSYDGLRRLIRWRLSSLERGESFMVSAQGKLWSQRRDGDGAGAGGLGVVVGGIGCGSGKDDAGVDDELLDVRFPVLLRCSSSSGGDQISNVLDFAAYAADGHPASVSSSKTNTFRLLHRLP